MALPFPIDPATNAVANPYFQDNGFVRGDQQRANNAQIWANCTDLDERVTENESDISTIEGQIVGLQPSANSASIFNVKATLSGTTVTLAAQDTSIAWRIALPLANGTVQWVTIPGATALSMVLPSATFNEQILFFKNTDGSATIQVGGDAAGVVLFWYIVYDSGTPYIGISRSPFHSTMPANYYHTPTSTTMTRVGAAVPSTWDAMIISKAGTLTDTSAPCICLGPLCTTTVNGTNGRFSSMALTPGEFPKFNNRQSPSGLIHKLRLDTSNGAGSTDIMIRKFLNSTGFSGYAANFNLAGGCSAAGGIGGTEVVFSEPGIYAMQCTNSMTNAFRGISLNSNQRTTSIGSITLADIMSISFDDNLDTVPLTGYFNAGDILRDHNDGSASTGMAIWSLVKVGWGPGW